VGQLGANAHGEVLEPGRVSDCYRDQAVTNAAQLADLLTSADAPVVPPGT
jgi:hypothetical protein